MQVAFTGAWLGAGKWGERGALSAAAAAASISQVICETSGFVWCACVCTCVCVCTCMCLCVSVCMYCICVSMSVCLSVSLCLGKQFD